MGSVSSTQFNVLIKDNRIQIKDYLSFFLVVHIVLHTALKILMPPHRSHIIICKVFEVYQGLSESYCRSVLRSLNVIFIANCRSQMVSPPYIPPNIFELKAEGTGAYIRQGMEMLDPVKFTEVIGDDVGQNMNFEIPMKIAFDTCKHRCSEQGRC